MQDNGLVLLCINQLTGFGLVILKTEVRGSDSGQALLVNAAVKAIAAVIVWNTLILGVAKNIIFWTDASF